MEGYGGTGGGGKEELTHAPGPTLCDFAQTAKGGEFLVRHAHIRLVRLYIRLGNRLQLRGRRCS